MRDLEVLGLAAGFVVIVIVVAVVLFGLVA